MKVEKLDSAYGWDRVIPTLLRSDEQTVEALVKALKVSITAIRERVREGELNDAQHAHIRTRLRETLLSASQHEDLSRDKRRIIEDFVEDFLTLELLDRPGYRFSQDWFSHHADTWSTHFSFLRHKPLLNFLEVGCFEGLCTCWLLTNLLTHPTSRITCVDTFTSYEDQGKNFDHNISHIDACHKVVKLIGPSQIILHFLQSDSYDFIYIDGSPTPTDVMQDAVLSWDLLRDEGVLVFDDYHAGRKPAIDAFLSLVENNYEVVLRNELQVAIAKRPHPDDA